MSATAEMRKSVRVKIQNGHLRIHHPVMPPLNCTLLDLSEGGARCRMETHKLDEFAATAWRQLLGSGKYLQVELLTTGQSKRCEIVSDVRHLRLLHEGEIEFGFRFHRPDSMQLEVIQRSVRMFIQNPSAGTRTAAGSTDEHSTTVYSAPPRRPTSTTTHAPAVQVPPQPPKATKKQSLVQMAKGLLRNLTGGPAGRPAIEYRGMKVGEILMRTGRLTPKQAVEAYERSRAAGQKFGRYLLANDLISPVELTRALSLQSGLPIVDLATVSMPETVKGLFSYDTLTEHQFIPFNQFGSTIYIAATQPLSKTVIKDLERMCKHTLKVFLAQDDVVSVAMNSPLFAPEKIKKKRA